MTIGLGTLAGLDDLPGRLAGFGAIPASLARAIATSAGTVTALITDEATGIATEAGALTYRPSQRLRDQIGALMATCQFPSCRQPVWRCDIDHRKPFDHQNPERGGRTDIENDQPLCRRHHLVKHHSDWQIRSSTERFTVDWTSPTGHRYTKKPPPNLASDFLNCKGYVTNPASALAERLDSIVAFSGLGRPDGAAVENTSIVEELAIARLLQHQFNQPSSEYDPPEPIWDRTAEGEAIEDPGQRDDGDDDDLPDEPPF